MSKVCNNCGQTNADWATSCGRCGVSGVNEDKYSPTPSRFYTSRPALARWHFSPSSLPHNEAQRFVEDSLDTDEPYTCRILRDNAEPMLLAWLAHKDGDDDIALHHVGHIYDEDWQEGCRLWITRRMEK